MAAARRLSGAGALLLRHAAHQAGATPAPLLAIDARIGLPAAGAVAARQLHSSAPVGAPNYNNTLDPNLARQTPPTNYGIRWGRIAAF